MWYWPWSRTKNTDGHTQFIDTLEFDTKVIFREIQGRRFDTYGELEVAVFKKFNYYRERFPMYFTHTTLIDWGVKNSYIKIEDDRFVVMV